MAKSEKRTVINYRKIGEQVHPMNMTRKEYINYLCHEFGFRIAQGWDGIERRHYKPNMSENKLFNIATRDEALEFLGITKSESSPDGINKRKSERRTGKKDIRRKKAERRVSILNSRRKEDVLALKTHRLLLASSLSFVAIYGLGVFIYNFTRGF